MRGLRQRSVSSPDAPKPPAEKILDPAGLDAALAKLPRPLVFTNGCFDLFHAGHADYLYRARSKGASLLVAVNDDESVRLLKGPSRPINPLPQRMLVLASMGAVDAVVPFHEATPLALIQAVAPEILVKGGDWTENEVVGGSWVRQRGGTVCCIPIRFDTSTSGLVERAKGKA